MVAIAGLARRVLRADAAPADDGAGVGGRGRRVRRGDAVLQDETIHQAQADDHLCAVRRRALSAGSCSKKNFLAIVFDQVFHLTPEGWRQLTLRWAASFSPWRVLNEIVWRMTSTDTWVAFKVFAVLPLTFIFAALQYPAADEIRREPQRAGAGRQLTRRQRLLDRRHEHGLQILRRDRADQLVGDAPVAADDEGLRHAIDAPVDRGAAVRIGADRVERIAVAADEAARVVGPVLVVDADEPDSGRPWPSASAAAPRRGRARTRRPRH